MFTEKLLRFTFRLGTGTFTGTSANTVTLEDLRATAQLSVNSGAASFPGSVLAVAVIFGMSLDQINQLTRAGLQYALQPNTPPNQITIEANDGVSGYTVVFSGIILDATPQFNRMPQTAFVISANSIQEMTLKPVAPNTFNGGTDVAQIMQSMAQTAGLKLENSGVSVKLASPYFPGTIIDQIVACARAANINHHIDAVAGVLAIWPKNGTRAGDPVMVSPATGMIGYPEFQNVSIRVRTLFNPALKVGVKMQVQSQLTAASGMFSITAVDHFLSSKLPDGDWLSEVQATPVPFLQSGGVAPGR
jgi:hypothetical protein